jgi:hypothetical protein
MKTRDFLEFLTSRETAPVGLSRVVRKDIELSFRSYSIICKFLAFQFLGAFFSLSVCPQFGLGLAEGHGITHHFRIIGDWACAAFCGSLFLSSGMMVAFIGMKGEELWWVWRRYRLPLIFLPTLLWTGLMFTNISLKLPKESWSYHLIWIIVAMIAQSLFFILRSIPVKRDLSVNRST